jgi:AraC-like DNA-binding protein
LKSAGFGELTEQALRDSDAWVDYRAALRLWAAAEEVARDPHLGIHIAQAAAMDSFHLHLYLVSASATLGDAYRCMCRYQRLINDRSRLELRVQGKTSALRHTIVPNGVAPRQVAEFLVAAWLRAGRHLTRTHWSPTEVRFAHDAPVETLEHERFFAAPVRFGAGENALVFPSALLDQPCPTADAGLLSILSRHADQILAARPDTETWTDRVRRAVTEQLAHGSADVRPLARQLGLSVRTLQRRLSAEDTSYGRVVDGIRRDLALRYIQDSRLSVAEIALLLDYSECSAFSRSFKRWFGRTASEFRTGKTAEIHSLPGTTDRVTLRA